MRLLSNSRACFRCWFTLRSVFAAYCSTGVGEPLPAVPTDPELEFVAPEPALAPDDAEPEAELLPDVPVACEPVDPVSADPGGSLID